MTEMSDVICAQLHDPGCSQTGTPSYAATVAERGTGYDMRGDGDEDDWDWNARPYLVETINGTILVTPVAVPHDRRVIAALWDSGND